MNELRVVAVQEAKHDNVCIHPAYLAVVLEQLLQWQHRCEAASPGDLASLGLAPGLLQPVSLLKASAAGLAGHQGPEVQVTLPFQALPQPLAELRAAGQHVHLRHRVPHPEPLVHAVYQETEPGHSYAWCTVPALECHAAAQADCCGMCALEAACLPADLTFPCQPPPELSHPLHRAHSPHLHGTQPNRPPHECASRCYN